MLCVGGPSQKDKSAWFYDKLGAYYVKSRYKVARELKESDVGGVLLREPCSLKRLNWKKHILESQHST